MPDVAFAARVIDTPVDDEMRTSFLAYSLSVITARAIPDVPGDVQPITEFPFFTFLYADLHAHMMALPITLLALTVGLSWVTGAVPSLADGGAQPVVACQLRDVFHGTQRREVQRRRDGEARWLLINAPVEDVWQKVISFWQENGILLAEQDPTVGVMRTSWIENRANISRDFITDTIRRALDGLYETGLRDQFRVRLERASQGRAELYLTHYGMEEQVVQGAEGEVANTIWVPRERDPGLEVEMLNRLMVYMGAADERTRARLADRKSVV